MSSSSQDRIAVVDVETTGLELDDRIVEFACVTMDSSGKVIGEWDSLVNPGRSVGPTRVHKVTDAMVSDAPSFPDLLPKIVESLDGAFIAAHNLPFDAGMIGAELARCHVAHDFGIGIDTLKLTKARLSVACAQYGINIERAHTALCDAQAAARLLLRACNGDISNMTSNDCKPVRVQWQPELTFGSPRAQGVKSRSVPEPAWITPQL